MKEYLIAVVILVLAAPIEILVADRFTQFQESGYSKCRAAGGEVVNSAGGTWLCLRPGTGVNYR